MFLRNRPLLILTLLNWFLILSCGSDSPKQHEQPTGSDSTPIAKVAASSTPARQRTMAPRKRILYLTDLNQDGIQDSIQLTTIPRDSTSFDSIRISLTGSGGQTFVTSDPWTTIDDWFKDTSKNALPTNLIFLAETKKQSVILLFGAISPAGYRVNFNILNIEKNKINMVLDQTQRHLFIEDAMSLSDTDTDGRLEFIYRQIFEFSKDTLEGKLGTYSPYFVYKVDDSCLTDKPLTRQYNEKNYVFAGYYYDEHIDIYYPDDKSKPRLLRKYPMVY